MINENGKPICYKWLSNECKWDKVGDVLSAANPNKNMHEGKVIKFIIMSAILDSEHCKEYTNFTKMFFLSINAFLCFRTTSKLWGFTLFG